MNRRSFMQMLGGVPFLRFLKPKVVYKTVPGFIPGAWAHVQTKNFEGSYRVDDNGCLSLPVLPVGTPIYVKQSYYSHSISKNGCPSEEE